MFEKFVSNFLIGLDGIIEFTGFAVGLFAPLVLVLLIIFLVVKIVDGVFKLWHGK